MDDVPQFLAPVQAAIDAARKAPTKPLDPSREVVARAICPKLGFCPRHHGCADFTCPPIIWPAADAALLAMGVMAPD